MGYEYAQVLLFIPSVRTHVLAHNVTLFFSIYSACGASSSFFRMAASLTFYLALHRINLALQTCTLIISLGALCDQQPLHAIDHARLVIVKLFLHVVHQHQRVQVLRQSGHEVHVGVRYSRK